MSRSGLVLLAFLLCSSCGLLRAPFRVAGGLVNVTAEVASAAVEVPVEGHRKRKARRAEKRKTEEEAKKKQELEQASRSQNTVPLENVQYSSDPLPAPPADASAPAAVQETAPPPPSADPGLPSYD